MKLLRSFFLALTAISTVHAFKWRLKDTLALGHVLRFTEHYMFATENGPPMLEQGAAYIDMDVNILVYTKTNETAHIAYAIFAASEKYHNISLNGLCDNTATKLNPWATNIRYKRVPTSYVGEAAVNDPSAGLFGTYFLWHVPVSVKYSINVQEWHNINFQLCADVETESVALLEGGVTFRNPYGFIPAELYGFLPFEGARMVAYFFLGVVYIYFFWRHKDSTLPLHRGVLFVFLVALAEATSWYSAYQTINLTGQPYCCPFPATVIASLILQIFRQTFARSLLLVVSLGYGIVRPKLMSAEWIAVAVMSVLYFSGAIIAQVSQIVLVNDIHGNSADSVLSYQVPELIMDVIFLSWIYLALGSTIRILTEFQQGYKLNLYKQLAFIIILFVSLFVMASILILLDKSNLIKWPWQWAWVQQVLWEVLNFSVLAAVCIICCPSDNSRRLSYASQLPTDDPDDDDYVPSDYYLDDEDEYEETGSHDIHHTDGGDDVSGSILGSGKKRISSKSDGVELSSWRSSLSNRISSISAGNNQKSSSNGIHQFSSLPVADEDDEEFGLNDSSGN